MRAPDKIPPAVRQMQSDVSNPAVSAWVAANAGSGKTRVLARRVINLLLDDVAPEKILCITFTKAAAANMAKRVFDTLAEWTTLDDAKLNHAIRAIAAVTPTRAHRPDQALSLPRPQRRRAHADSPGHLADADVVHVDTPRHDTRRAAGTLSDPVELVTVE